MYKATTVLLVCLLVLSVSCIVRAENWAVSYDASLGTLPTDQGWQGYYEGDSSPAPYVSNGILHQGLTASYGTQTWSAISPVSIDMSGSTPFIAESCFRVLQSSFWQNGTDWRNGFNVVINDQSGRCVQAGFSSSGVSLRGDQNNVMGEYGVQFVPFDTTSTTHTYRVVTSSNVGYLYADNALLATTPIGSPYGGHNGVWFGDGTYAGNSQVDIQYVRFGSVPEPSGILALLTGVGGLGGLMLRRRKWGRGVTR
jgi:hypothetical protein